MAKKETTESNNEELSELEQLKKDLSDEVVAREDLKKTLQFVQADFENFKKRQERDFSEKIKLSAYDIISKVLPTLDDFEHSIANLQNNSSDNNDFIEGLSLIYSNLLGTLKKEGLEEINPLNESFDPFLHEALMQEERDGVESSIVLDVLQKGYKLNGKIIRHAKVKISK